MDALEPPWRPTWESIVRAMFIRLPRALMRFAALPLLVLAMIVQAPQLRAADSGDSGDSGTDSTSRADSDSKNSAQHDRHEEHAHGHGHDEDQGEAAKLGFLPGQQRSTGSVMVAGQRINYVAYAGTIVVHPKGWDDVPQDAPKDQDKGDQPEASMFYVAYFRVPEGAGTGRARGGRSRASEPGAAAPTDLSADSSLDRPITFLYNGGPGSSSVWLHMGAFGPRRVMTLDDTHTPAAPYQLVNNDHSLLDASDLVFIDAPGTGFSRIGGKDRDKNFYGVDQDAYAFSDFIVQFLSKYGRWNSPKYLFGESYGTTRSAVLINMLENERYVDFNGVMLLSQILGFDNSPDAPQVNPGIDLPYELALPSYAATAWYHHRLPGQQGQPPGGQQPDLQMLLKQVEHFAMNDYRNALDQGTALPVEQRQAIAQQLHQYTGLPVDYILKANLRINGGEFEKNLQGDQDLTTGRLDTRFSGPTYDPLSEEAEYDPQSAAISSAYVSSFNGYVRRQLHYGQGKLFKPEIDIENWNYQHQPPGQGMPLQASTNVMPDLEIALKTDPRLHILLNAGYFDLATPFYEGVYEMQHLRIPDSLRSNISFAFYQTGHMVYVSEKGLAQLHDNAAKFIHDTQNHLATTP
jgi:carboxypeptidase C (cathepsin A)